MRSVVLGLEERARARGVHGHELYLSDKRDKVIVPSGEHAWDEVVRSTVVRIHIEINCRL
eukprot:3589040-Pyramimonas_sp.AAC.1